MHLELGPHRFDLRDRTVVIARVASLEHPRGADALWIDDTVSDDPAAVSAAGLPAGADAADAGHVHRLVRSGVVVVGVRTGDHDAVHAAAERGVSVLVDQVDVPFAATVVPAERLLVTAGQPVEGAIACCSPAVEGPAGWGGIVAALAAGVRVVRATGAPSVRRVTTVIDRLLHEREVLAR